MSAWRWMAIVIGFVAALGFVMGLNTITMGYQMQTKINDTGIVILYHMNEIIIWVSILVLLSAAIFCALMDIGDSVRKTFMTNGHP